MSTKKGQTFNFWQTAYVQRIISQSHEILHKCQLWDFEHLECLFLCCQIFQHWYCPRWACMKNYVVKYWHCDDWVIFRYSNCSVPPPGLAVCCLWRVGLSEQVICSDLPCILRHFRCIMIWSWSSIRICMEKLIIFIYLFKCSNKILSIATKLYDQHNILLLFCSQWCFIAVRKKIPHPGNKASFNQCG